MKILLMFVLILSFQSGAFATDVSDVIDDVGDGSGNDLGERTPVIDPPDLPAAEVLTDPPPPTDLEECLASVFGFNPEAASSDEIVVSASRFGNHFYTLTHLRGTARFAPQGSSFFLTSGNRFSPDTSFRVLDTTVNTAGPNNFAQWTCGGAERLRRLRDDDSYDESDDSDDADKVTANLNRGDQWGRGRQVEMRERHAVYFLKTGEHHFRVACGVRRGGFLAAHQNIDCDAEAVAMGSNPSTDLKVCRRSDDSAVEFIEKAIRQRERHLRRNTPDTTEEWNEGPREVYENVMNKCPTVIGNDSGAKDALKDYGKEMNERIRAYNRNRPTGQSAVTEVRVQNN